MKLTTVLLIVTIMQVSASSFGQKLTFEARHVSIEKIFSEIKKQTGYSVFLIGDLKTTGYINARFKNTSLNDVLNEIFKNKGLAYAIEDKTIVVRKVDKTILDNAIHSIKSIWNNIDISGKIVDENGNALQGAVVRVKDTRIAVVTNVNGIFQLRGIKEQSILEITYIGYKSLTINSSSDLSRLIMQRDDFRLQEQVVKGYYTTSRKLNTGNIVSIKSADIENQPLTNPIQALQGMSSGLFVQQTNGMAASKTKVLIRGNNSFMAGSTPLYIIDGVPFNGSSVDQQMSGAMTIGGQPNGGTDALNSINPADIESIQILKDADATAIYGSRGANGVILITTKKAVAGKTKLNVNLYTGASQVTSLLPTLNTNQYLEIRRRAFANDKIVPTIDNAPDLLLWDKNQNTNFQKEIMGKTAWKTDATASFSGGDKQTTFRLSGTYHDENTVFGKDFKYTRGSMNMSVNHTSTDGKLKIDFSTLYSNDKNKMTIGDLTGQVIEYPNNYPVHNPDGSLYYGGNFYQNPEGLLSSYYKTKSSSLIINSTITYSILSNLKIRGNLGHNNVSLDQKLISSPSSLDPVFGDKGTGFYTINETKNYLFEPQLDYNQNIGLGKFSATLGGTYQYSFYNQPLYVIAANFPSEALIENYSAAGTIFINKQQEAEYKYASVYGRVNYSYLDRYVLNATFRRDASSRFGPNKQEGDFGSLGAAWVFSDESFLKDSRLLSLGKLRGSFGTVGNDQIPNYAYLSTYSAAFFPYGSEPSYIPSGIANSTFSWETTRKLEVALELGFFDNKLSLNAAWYRNRSSNLLAQAPLTAQTGFQTFTGNVDAQVQNKGIEIDIKGTPLMIKDFSWNSSFNFTANQNKLLKFPNLNSSTYANRYIIGQPLNLMPLYEFTGFRNGQATVADKDNNGTISQGIFANGNGDFINAGTLDPKFYGGFSNTFKYKNLSLDVFFNFVKQKGYAMTGFPGLLKNQYIDVLNSQFTPSTSASSPSYASYINYFQSSTAILTDASYIRLRNVSLSYSLPNKWLKAINVPSARFYVSGQNLLTFTNYKGFDPETQIIRQLPSSNMSISMPPLKSIIAGFQCSF